MQHSTAIPKLAWHFKDEGTHLAESARELYRSEPTFREMIDQFDQRLKTHNDGVGTSVPMLTAWLSEESQEQPPHNLQLFALQAGLAKLWNSWGIEPDTVLGMGVGQYSAACAAGGLCYFDALTLIAEREKIVQAPSKLRQESGQEIAVADLPAEVIEALDRFEQFADTLNYYPPNLPLVDSLQAETVPVHRSLGGSYWREHCLATPKTDESLQLLHESECDYFLTLGPAGESELPSSWLSSLAVDQDASTSMLSVLGQLYVGGARPDFAALDSPWPRQRLSLPTYPFQKKRYWITEISAHADSTTETVQS